MAPTLGFALSSEEHTPLDLVCHAALAEEAGFAFALISDHFHPWTDQQGHASFVWSTLGGIAGATRTLRVGTGVTCPLLRIHPAIIAQAAASVASMMPGRFFLGVGTGEALNEHVLGDKWPATWERRDRLAEAVDVIRTLWEGDLTTYVGDYYRVENARLYTLPDAPIDICVAAAGPAAAKLAAGIGDGLIATSPDGSLVQTFVEEQGVGPRYGQIACCWAPTLEEARRTAYRSWPNAGLKGTLSQELPLPSHFEAAAAMVTEDDVADTVVCGPDPAAYLDAIAVYEQAGFDHVYLHQIGPDQRGFIDFARREILPACVSTAAAA